jgi:hypothetical protein
MKLHEQIFYQDKCTMREVRKLSEKGKQTSIVTTNKILSTEVIAASMFARWSQENFFRYMRQEYAIDKIIHLIEKQIESLIAERKKIPYKIPLSQMPESIRYNRLNKESKILQNLIKMICYRAETALANLLSPYYKREKEEIRALIKSIIKAPINLEVDQENELLKITLYPLSNQRSNEAVSKICEKVNATDTIYPGTKLKLFFKITTVECAPGKEF